MYDLSDTICAICTPPGRGSIAAIRISGPDSWKILEKIFSHSRGKFQTCPYKHMHAVHGYIKDNEKIIDEVIILPFKSPNSFTAEDVIEIFCHGGSRIASMILDLCLKNGARRASAGEFTFRAFVNRRIDLTEAEAINEIISADTEKRALAASEVLGGSLKEKVNIFREKILNLVTTVESSLEFPMDVPSHNKKEFVSELTKINNELEELIKSSKEGQILKEGIKVSIIGAPNVGKSSLLNQLLENQRAIVTNEPGTTRDTIEEKIIIDRWPVVLVDTAGIRKSKPSSAIEELGIERSKSALEKSDIALVVFDLSNENGTKQILELAGGKSKITIGNKVDLTEAQNTNQFDILISAKYGTNIDSLKKLIVEKIKFIVQSTTGKQQSTNYYVNQRQKELLLQCSSYIKNALEMFNNNKPEDLTLDELKNAISKLDEVTGRKINDDVIANIFAKFCIGK